MFGCKLGHRCGEIFRSPRNKARQSGRILLIEPIYLDERVCFGIRTGSMAVLGSGLRLVADEKV